MTKNKGSPKPPTRVPLLPLFAAGLLACQGPLGPLEDDGAEVAPARDPVAEAMLADALAAYEDASFAAAIDKALDVATIAADREVRHQALTLGMAAARAGSLGEEAERVLRVARLDRPELAPVWDLWQADTALGLGRIDDALSQYEALAARHVGTFVDGRPFGIVVRRQEARALQVAGRPADAAAVHRAMLDAYPAWLDAPYEVAAALYLDEVARGVMPEGSVGGWLHETDCQAADCVLGDGALDVPADFAPGLVLRVDEADAARLVAPVAIKVLPAAALVACSTPTASDGFDTNVIAYDHPGYTFMQAPDSTGGYHPGLDMNGAGAGNADCGIAVRAPSRACVTDAGVATWGSLTMQAYFMPDTIAVQVGHMAKVNVSYGGLVSKMMTVGSVGNTGTSYCHAHVEVRDWDHPDRMNADYYNSGSKANVGDWYENPLPFFQAHHGYKWGTWADEDGFSRTGSWTTRAGVGDRDDMVSAATTSAATNTARRNVTPQYSGVHELWLHVPYNYATSAKANVLVKRGASVVLSAKINQAPLLDAWAHAGSVSLTANTVYTIEINSGTGEVGKMVGLDDVLLLIKP